MSPVAIVLGVMGKKKADESNGQMGGRGMALAGIILGAIGTLIFVGWIAFIVYSIATGNDVDYSYSTS